MGFMATGMAVALAGGIPVYCDVDESLQIDPSKLEELITERTVALAPTHHWGNVCDMKSIMAIAGSHNLRVVEDCAQAPGALCDGRFVGTIGDVGCFSIAAYKIVGGGESGLVVTGDQLLFDRICQLIESGGLWRPERCAPARYEGELFIGTNYRLSELEAAVNVAQFDKLGRYCAEYRKVSRRIMGQLETYREIRPQTINDRDGFIGYMLRFFPDTDERAASITQALVAEGISAHHRGDAHKPDYHLARDMFPINLKTGHIPGASVFDDPRNARSRDLGGYRPGQCPVSEKLFGREVSISLEHWYGDEDCDSIARGINKVLSAHCTPDDRGKAWI
jgi:8-amino-3,8-dideoxy-alpha-D-manno-octulosonate transaminase